MMTADTYHRKREISKNKYQGIWIVYNCNKTSQSIFFFLTNQRCGTRDKNNCCCCCCYKKVTREILKYHMIQTSFQVMVNVFGYSNEEKMNGKKRYQDLHFLASPLQPAVSVFKPNRLHKRSHFSPGQFSLCIPVSMQFLLN